MHEREIFEGELLEDAWLTLEQVAAACRVEPQWLGRHLAEGYLPQAQSAAGTWRFTAMARLRARRMHAFERDFGADPEMAALVADLLEELDALRSRLRRAGLS